MKTNAGQDFQAQVMASAGASSNGTGTSAPANYMALSTSATAPSASDTVLAGEITTGGGGLIRASATPAHTAGTNTYTLTKTFTVNGSDSVPVTIQKIGIFNAASSGTLVFETALTPTTATLSAVGDQLTITETVTM